jgi:hypothetical protein
MTRAIHSHPLGDTQKEDFLSLGTAHPRISPRVRLASGPPRVKASLPRLVDRVQQVTIGFMRADHDASSFSIKTLQLKTLTTTHASSDVPCTQNFDSMGQTMHWVLTC